MKNFNKFNKTFCKLRPVLGVALAYKLAALMAWHMIGEKNMINILNIAIILLLIFIIGTFPGVPTICALFALALIVFHTVKNIKL